MISATESGIYVLANTNARPRVQRRPCRSIQVGTECIEFNFDTPWSTRLNPHYRPALEAESNDVWATRHGLDYGALARFRPLLLAAYTMPRASQKGLRAGARFISFLFAHDDLFVDHAEASCAELFELLTQYKAALAGDLIGEHPLARMFTQVLWDLREFSPDPHHFNRATASYFDANVRELRSHGSTLATVDDYWRERLDASAVVPVLELSLLVNGIELPDELRESELYASLVEDAMKYICIYNDFVSLPKEIACGDSHNILTVCRRAEGLADYTDAATYVSERLVAPLIARFERNGELLCARARDSAQLRTAARAVGVMRDWMGGHVGWEDASHRHASSMM